MNEERAAKGRELIERLTGNAAAVDRFPEPFRRYTLEHLFGDVWQGEALGLEERSLLTCAILTALAREHEQRVHFAGARRLGIPREKMVEMITHVAHYSGWPTAVGGLRTLEEVWPKTE